MDTSKTRSNPVKLERTQWNLVKPDTILMDTSQTQSNPVKLERTQWNPEKKPVKPSKTW